MTLEALQNGRITQACQDGNREFISLLACINAAGGALPPALIYKGEALQSTWLEDLNHQLAYFSFSPNGWSSNAIGIHWLKNVFQRHTSHQRRRLLIVDGHSSHVNMQFIDLCDQLNILLLILPAHSTHRLQPLDVSLFAPLASYYTTALNDLTCTSLSMVSMTKRSFFSIFWKAWGQAFTSQNIQSGWRKTGIWPFDPNLVISQITKPPPKTVPHIVKTPMTSRSMRRAQKQYYGSPNSPLRRRIFHASERLTAQHAVDQHMIKGLTEALRDEKKRRQRGKRLNLVGKEDSGAQFFSPGAVQTAREFQAAKDAKEVSRQQEVANKKLQQTIRKAQKEEEKKIKQVDIARRRQIAVETKVQKEADKQVQKELQQAAKHHSASLNFRIRQSTKPPKARITSKKPSKKSDNVAAAGNVAPAGLASSSGRSIRRPQRFEI